MMRPMTAAPKRGSTINGTDNNGTNSIETNRNGTDNNGTNRNGTNRNGTDRNGTSRNGTNRNGTNRNETNKNGTNRNGARNAKSAPSHGPSSSQTNGYIRPKTGLRRQTQSSESFMSNASSGSAVSGRNKHQYGSRGLHGMAARNRNRKWNTEDDLRCSSSEVLEPQGVVPPAVGWQALQQEINNIDDCSAMFQGHNAVPLSRSRPSDAFNRVMGDMKARLAEHKAAMAEAKAAAARAARDKEAPRPDDILEVDEYESASDDGGGVGSGPLEPVISPVRQAALRGWQIIRRSIQEVAMENKKKNSSYSWAFLRQHISNMTDTEKARHELYQKYIYKPSTWWSDGLVNFPAHIFDSKRQGARGGRGARAQSAFTPRPMSSNPGSPAWRPSSAVHKNNGLNNNNYNRNTYSMPKVGWR